MPRTKILNLPKKKKEDDRYKIGDEALVRLHPHQEDFTWVIGRVLRVRDDLRLKEWIYYEVAYCVEGDGSEKVELVCEGNMGPLKKSVLETHIKRTKRVLEAFERAYRKAEE